MILAINVFIFGIVSLLLGASGFIDLSVAKNILYVCLVVSTIMGAKFIFIHQPQVEYARKKRGYPGAPYKVTRRK